MIFFDSSNNIINRLAKSYSVDLDALMSSRTMKCTSEARFEARQGVGPPDLKRVKFDKKTMSGDVGFSASEGLKELLNLEAFQKESHPVLTY